jgi:aerobic carbon-monoxide dehydrogenase small subunit
VTTFTLNGRERTVHAAPLTPLSTVLREQLNLTGTKVACEEGFCGACTVLVDDEPATSCLVPVAHVDGRSVRTIESLGTGGELSPLQAALQANDAVQCGMCFPGVVMSLTALLERDPAPDDDAVRTALVGNICRCTGYERIVEAALATAEAAA